jgi:hypothetical protein
MMKKSIFLLALILALFPAIGSAAINPVTEITYDISESSFMAIPIANEDSRYAVQELMDTYSLDSYSKVRLYTGNLQHTVTSPDSVYTVSGEPHQTKHLYNGSIEVSTVESSLVYPVAFSPDSKYFVYPFVAYQKMFDENHNPLNTYALYIASSETGETVAIIDGIQVPLEDFLGREYINDMVQVYWSEDSTSIIFNYVTYEWGTGSDGSLSYVKCDIDYDMVNTKEEPVIVETTAGEVYTGPSTIVVEPEITVTTEEPEIAGDSSDEDTSIISKILSYIQSWI